MNFIDFIFYPMCSNSIIFIYFFYFLVCLELVRF